LPHPRFAGKTKLGPYGDFITQVDWTVGQVMQALDDAKVAENTLLVVTSDNGSFMYRYPDKPIDHAQNETVHGYHPDTHQANGPLRGTKADIWEAGHRVPFFVRWPGKVKAGTTSPRTICHTDLLATVAEVAGVPFDSKSAEDSFSFLASLQQQSATERPPVIHQSGSGHLAIREGKWKLVLGNGSGGRQQPRGQPFGQPFQLFDLEADLGEQQNVIESNRELAEALYRKFETISHGDHVAPWNQPRKQNAKQKGKRNGDRSN
jgi:arylsulfatase A-like enzyme